MVCLIISTWTAFATGYAYAKAVFDYERANLGVKRRASRVDEVDKPLDTPVCAKTIIRRLQGKRSAALNRSKSRNLLVWLDYGAFLSECTTSTGAVFIDHIGELKAAWHWTK